MCGTNDAPCGAEFTGGSYSPSIACTAQAQSFPPDIFILCADISVTVDVRICAMKPKSAFGVAVDRRVPGRVIPGHRFRPGFP